MTAACRLHECADVVPTAGALLATLPSIPLTPLPPGEAHMLPAPGAKRLLFPAALGVPATSDAKLRVLPSIGGRLTPVSQPYQMIYLK